MRRSGKSYTPCANTNASGHKTGDSTGSDTADKGRLLPEISAMGGPVPTGSLSRCVNPSVTLCEVSQQRCNLPIGRSCCSHGKGGWLVLRTLTLGTSWSSAKEEYESFQDSAGGA